MTDKTPTLIGRVEHVTLPKAGIGPVAARIDTGAKTSSIWASHIREHDGELSFILLGKSSPSYTGEVITTRDYHTRVIASSNGKPELRYVVKITLCLAGRTVRASFTLANRASQTYAVLIGRRVLHGKFIVDVTKGQPLIAAERQRSRTLQSQPKGDKQ